MSKEKAVEYIKQVKDSLFITQGLYLGKDDLLNEYMNLNIERCNEALKELKEEQ